MCKIKCFRYSMPKSTITFDAENNFQKLRTYGIAAVSNQSLGVV